MTDHRIAKLRFLFVTLYCAILVWFFPGLNLYIWLIPLGLFMPVIATASPCLSICNTETQTDEIEITFTGIVDGTFTDCTNLNRTIIVPFLGTCTYTKNTTGVILNGGASTLTTRFAWDSSIGGGNLFDYASNASDQVAAWDPIGAGLRDCSSSPAVSLPPDSVLGTAVCDFTSATATAIPTGDIL